MPGTFASQTAVPRPPERNSWKIQGSLRFCPVRAVASERMELKKPKDGLTIPQVAEKIGVDPATVRNWIRTGKLAATRWGPDDAKIIRVHPDDIKDFGPRPVVPKQMQPKDADDE
jgi:transposase-like protein